MQEKFRAIVFDFNGVIIDDEPLHLELFRRMLLEEGMTFDASDYHEKYLGLDDRRCFERALSDHGRQDEAANSKHVGELIARKNSYYHEAIERRDMLFPGIVDLVSWLAGRMPLAIASGALRNEIEAALDRANLRRHFQVIVACEDVTESKPSPEGYLKAIAGIRLLVPGLSNLEAGDCLAIEDSVAGVEAAKRAGMRCLAVTGSYPAVRLGRADWIVNNIPEWFREP